ncbi:MAG: tRNA-dihydrouridine synthase [Planctomycetaceae bacterium]|jgi:tRNA-dihydrouridine synthase B|nr:tRNA-dihydrouridine synthase [Planctomycetaceae bacterium]
MPESTKTLLYSAPMAGYTNYAYRELLRMFGGVDLITTEMVSARSFVELEMRGSELPSRLWGVREESRPLAVQIWDNNPDTLSLLAQRLAFEFKVSVIDLNFGCPAKQIANRSAGGSFLLQFPDRIGDIVQKVAAAAKPVPVTAKIRLGRTADTINAIDVAQAVENAGAAGLTVHGRTASEMYRGNAHWDKIAAIKPKLKSIPLIGNGDIQTVDDALFRIKNYPVDGIMIGRGSIERPWIFRQIAQALRGEPVDSEPAVTELRNLIVKHFNLLQQQFDEHTALFLIRKIVCHYAAKRVGARKFRNDVCSAKEPAKFFQLIDDFFH